MRARLLLLVVAAAVALTPLNAGASLAEAWAGVQQALSGSDVDQIAERVQDLLAEAHRGDARRLTPYAEALVAWARVHPGEAGIRALRMARELDADLAAPHFLEARMRWAGGSYPQAALELASGWMHILKDAEARRVLLVSAGLWALLALTLAVVATVVLATASHLRMVAHDAFELGLLLFEKANAVVFATVVLTLPVFAGLGPIWLLAYLFALTWTYMRPGQRIVSGLLCLLVVVLAPLAELWQTTALRPQPVAEKVARMLEQRRIDASTLRDFADLEPSLDTNSTYHLVMGELLRMHGDQRRARVQYRKATIVDPKNAMAHVFRGNISLEDGDVARSVQEYSNAVELDPNDVLAHVNLAFALDQMNRFQEADRARDTARKLVPSGARVGSLGVRGQLPRIRYPRLGAANIEQIRTEVPPATRHLLGVAYPIRHPWMWFLSPLSAPFWVSGLLGTLLLWVRSQWMWTAQACSKCGKIFCPRCKSATESSSYCSQCISVFLKRDKVAIEHQHAKQRQIRRWLGASAVGRRVAAVLLPGGGLVLSGKLWQGFLVGASIWVLLSGCVVWVPLFIPSVEPQASLLPVQVLLGLLFLVTWLASITLTWHRR